VTGIGGHVLLQLHIAACCGYTRVVQFLISHRVDLGCLDSDSWQPIHCAGYWAQVGAVCHRISFLWASHWGVFKVITCVTLFCSVL